MNAVRQETRPPTSATGLTGQDVRLIGGCAVATVLAGAARLVSLPSVVPFLIAAVALALLASLVGRAVDALGDRLGAGATGVVQSALGNLPELFVCLFALRDGLYDVVDAALVGSVLANVLLVLGLAFIVGGLRHGTQRFPASQARTLSLLLVLSVAAWLIPSLTAALHTPAAGHERGLSIITAILLLLLFGLSIPASLSRSEPQGEAEQPKEARWPLALTLGILFAAAVAAAFVSDWFVAGLQPAMDALHISEAFAGLVIVAIAGNAVENVVGVQLAARNQTDYALSVILQSPLQIALVLAPVLVLVAPLVGATFTLVLSPLLVASLIIAVIVTVLVVNDGESTWLEGVTLVVLYALIATSFWWG
ncbi:MAG TPA: calcium/proton exchanger [Kineosporiaceae bacterium]|nr:calcium/proton exchanger [Kineosporiaceae bacterium]